MHPQLHPRLILLSLALTALLAPIAQAAAPAPAPRAPASPAAPTAAPTAGAPAAVPSAAPSPMPSALPSGAGLPTVEQLRAQLATSPQDVLRNVAKLLALKGDAANGYDRYELFSLRGEAYLRTKANAMSADAFAAAMKVTEDQKKRDVARANELLIRRSKPTGYTPRTPSTRPTPGVKPGAPLPIIEETDRKVAMGALLNDELAQVEPKLNAAKAAQGLQPVVEAVKALSDVRAIEIAATGASDQAKQRTGDLGARAHELISNALDAMSKKTEEISTSASRQNVSRDYAGNVTSAGYGMAGLISTDSAALNDVMATCENVEPVAKELATVTGGTELDADAKTAQKLRARAKEVLEYDYNTGGRYGTTPTRIPMQPPIRTGPTNVGTGTR